MKQIHFYLFLFLFLNISFCNAQDYKPLLDDYNEWHLRYCFSGDCSTDIYYTDGDTIVDGLSFKILDGYHYVSRKFLLREVVEEKKVYIKIILPNEVKDYLLYDFSLGVGDSIDIKNPITPFQENAGYYKIDEIETLPLADGMPYKHYYLSPTASNSNPIRSAIWVEGVGSLSIINAPGGEPDVNGVGKLGCMFKNGDVFYTDFSIVEACLPTVLNTNENDTPIDKVLLHNTEFENHFKLINTSTTVSISVHSMAGQRIKTIDNKDLSNTMLLDLTGFQKGMYFTILTDVKGNKTIIKIYL